MGGQCSGPSGGMHRTVSMDPVHVNLSAGAAVKLSC